MESVYLDFNATTPIHDEVARQMSGWLHAGEPSNPSSLHRHGREARRDLEEARQRLASFLGVVPSELHFTSGGTESNNLAMFGLAPTDAPLHVGATEHPSILEPAKQQWLQGRLGGLLEVDSFGRIRDFEVVEGA
ncbi:MAG: aminotransferase class V-fold PLP-dependent enzyme, partial [Planctomycetota bacterium]